MGNSGWRGLDDTRLDRLFENRQFFRPELSMDDPADLSSWIGEFEGHHLRLTEIEQGQSYALYFDGEPMGELDNLPPNWKFDGLL